MNINSVYYVERGRISCVFLHLKLNLIKIIIMKKLFITLLLIVFTITISAQQDSLQINSTTSEVERLVDKYSSKIEATILSLAESLKQPAEHVYKIIIKQQSVNSIIWLITALLFILLIFTKNFWLNKIDKLNNTNEDFGYWLGLVFLCIIPAIVGGIILIVQLEIIMTGFINPEYGAIKDIVNMIK